MKMSKISFGTQLKHDVTRGEAKSRRQQAKYQAATGENKSRIEINTTEEYAKGALKAGNVLKLNGADDILYISHREGAIVPDGMGSGATTEVSHSLLLTLKDHDKYRTYSNTLAESYDDIKKMDSKTVTETILKKYNEMRTILDNLHKNVENNQQESTVKESTSPFIKLFKMFG